MWLTRNKKGELYLFKYRPVKDENTNQWVVIMGWWVKIPCLGNEFPEVKREDKEPTELILKKE